MKIERFNEGREFDIYYQNYNLDSKEDELVLIRDLNDLEKNRIKHYIYSHDNTYEIFIYFKRTPKIDLLVGYFDNSSFASIEDIKNNLPNNGYTQIKRDDLEKIKYIVKTNKFNL